MLFISDDVPCESGFAQLLADLAVLMDDGGLPLRLFSTSQTQGATPLAELQIVAATGTTASKPTQWKRRREIAERIRAQLSIIIAMSRRTVVEFAEQFYTLFQHALILNMDYWTRRDMVSYCTSALRQQCDLSKSEVCKNLPQAFFHSVWLLFRLFS